MEKITRTALIEERKRRKWSQQALADQIGTTQNNVSRWELGLTTPSPYFIAKLCELFDKNAQDLGLLSAKTLQNDNDTLRQERESIVPPPISTDEAVLHEILPVTSAGEAALHEIPPVTSGDEPVPHEMLPATLCFWGIPYPRNPFFTGREQILLRLHEIIHPAGSSALSSQSCALSGLGGSGKTQTAIEYAYRYADDYTAIFWLNAETPESLIATFVVLAELLDLPEKQEQEHHHVVSAVTRWLNTHPGWLLIFDNVEEIELVQGFVPPARHGSLLFTSRRRVLGMSAQMLHLEKMTVEEGVRFLLSRIWRCAPTSDLGRPVPSNATVAQEIVVAMDGLPLALDQAAAYIEETQCSLEDYLHRYHQQQSRLLSRRGSSGQDHPASVETTFSLSFRQVEQRNPTAVEVLRLCAFLTPDAIPEELFYESLSHENEHEPAQVTDLSFLDETIAVLGTYSLIYRDTATKMLNIHRLVQAVLQDQMDEPGRGYWVERTVLIVNQAFPETGQETTWPQCQRILPQGLACASLIERWHVPSLEAGQLLSKMGAYFLVSRQYAQAETLLNRARVLLVHVVGEQHLQVASCDSDLGLLYHHQGQYAQAERHYEQALMIQQQILPPTHIDILVSLNNLAGLVYNQGKYAQAETLFQQLLLLREETFGADHLEVATGLNNLAGMLFEQGKYIQAEALLQRALAIRERELGPEHLHTLQTWGNLANTYRNLTRYGEAEQIHLHILQLREKLLGSEHVYIATSLYDLSRLYHDMGQKEQAERFSRRSLEMYEKVLGPEHPHTLRSLTHLARLYQEQGQYRKAEVLCLRVYSAYEKTLGTDHPDAAGSQFTLACLYLNQDDTHRSQHYYQQALAIWGKTLGLDHPQVVHTIEHYTQLMSEQSARSIGRTAQA